MSLRPAGYPPPPSGFLEFGTAWRTFLRHGLRLDVETPTLGDLLRWGETDAARAALSGPAGRHRDRIGEVLRARRGAGCAPRSANRVRGPRCGSRSSWASWRTCCGRDGSAGDETFLTARVRFERPVGAKKLSAQTATSWGDAAAHLVRALAERDEDIVVTRWLSRAQDLLTDLDALDIAFASDVLPWAFTERLIRAGRVLSAAVDSPADAAVETLRGASALVERHLLAQNAEERDRVDRLKMAGRLLRRSVAPASSSGADLVSALVGIRHRRRLGRCGTRGSRPRRNRQLAGRGIRQADRDSR
jgi:hypothetical protein